MACENGKCALTGEVRKLRDAGIAALRAGDVGQAESLLRRSVALSEDGGGLDVSTAHSAYRLALALHRADHHDEAARHFEKAMALARQRAGCGSKLYRTILGHFARSLSGSPVTVGE